MNFFQDVIGMLSNPAFLKVVKTLLCYLAFAAAVDALPKPADVKNGFLKWLLAFLHGLAGNVRNAAAAIKLPGSPPAAMLLIALLPIAYCLSPGQAAAQNFTTITASHIQSDVSGVNLVRGNVCFTPTDQNDTPIIVHDGAGGLVSYSRPACGLVNSGTIPTGFAVANSATTNPAGIYYRIQITDLCNGCSTQGKVVLDLRKVANVSGASFSLDSYVPTGTVTPPLGNAYWDIPEIAAPGNPASGFERFYASLSTHFASCLTSAGGNCSPSGGGGGYSTIQNAGAALAQQLTANFFGGMVCANNVGASRTDCQIDTSSAFNPTWAGNHTFNGNANLAGGFKINGAAAAGKIPIGDGTNFVPGDPLVQGLFAEGNTTAQNPVNVGGFDTAGTPAIHGTKVLNGNPAGTEYGIVTRPIPSGTQTVSVSNTPAVTAAQLPAALDGSGFLKTHEQGTAAVSGTVTANAGSGTYNIQANASMNETQVAGTAIDVNSGLKSAGTQRVVIATDQPQLTNALKVDGSAVTQPVSGTVTANAGSGTFAVKPVDSGGADATDTVNHAVKVNIVAGGGTGGGPADAASNAAASESDAARQKVTAAIRVLDTAQSAGSQLVTAKGDQASGLWVNCKAGCSSAGDTATGSTALGALNATITIALAGETGATFQLQSGGTGIYTVTPQCSFDTGTLYNVAGYIQDPVTGQLTLTAVVASAQATTDYPVLCAPHATNAQMKVTAYTSGTANWLARATVNNGPFVHYAAVSTSAPTPSNNTIAPLSMTTAGAVRVDNSAVTQPVSGTVTANAGTGTFNIQANASVNETQVAGTAIDVNSGVKSAGTQRVVLATDQPALTNALKVDGSAVTQPVSGTVTANVGTTNGLALDASVTGLEVAQASTTSGQKGAVVQGAVTTNAPAYTTAQTDPLSLDTAGLLRVSIKDTPQNTNALKVDGSAVTQPVSGTVTANAGSGTYNIQANASVNVNQVAGSAVSTAATGVQKVGAVGNAGVALDAVIGAAAPANVIAGGLKDTAGNSQASLSDTNGRQIVKTYPDTTTTSYRASKKFAASSTTDNAVMPGNATNTVLVTKVLLTCTQTTAGQINVELLKRSTADTSGTSAAMTAVPMDANYAAAVSAPLSYTGTGPTVGTPIGDLDNLQVGCMASGTATPNDIFIFHPDKPIILRGTAQQIAVNVGNAALTGGNLSVTFEWEETTTP